MASKALAVTLVLLTLPAPAAGAIGGVDAQSADVRIGISGFVPVICRASVEGIQSGRADGLVSLGSMREFCNNPRGYTIYADYSANLADGALIVDGVKIPLDKSGSVQIVQTARAGVASRAINLELPGEAEGGSISFRIQPL